MLSGFSPELFVEGLSFWCVETEAACLPFRLPAAWMTISDSGEFDIPSGKARAGHVMLCYARKMSYLPARHRGGGLQVSGLVTQDETGDAALFDGQLKTAGGDHAELADLAGHCGEAIAFQGFFRGPEYFLFVAHVHEYDAFGFDTECFQSRRVDLPCAADPDAGAAGAHQSGDQTGGKAAGGGDVLRTGADQFVYGTGREAVAGKGIHDGPEAQVGLPGGGGPGSLQAEDFALQLLDDILFGRG
jgi:hypothetical protein